MRHIWVISGVFLLAGSVRPVDAQDLGGWLEPPGGWGYVYEANEDQDRDGEFLLDGEDSLDGTWTHSNGSDEWDGSGPGDEFRPDETTPAAPGGAGIVFVAGAAEDGGDAEVLSMVDTGDPRSRGFSDPSNRKMWFCHDTLFDPVDDLTGVLGRGFTMIVRSRLHPDVDPDTPGWQLPDGGVDNDAGQGAAPGYTLRDGGKGGHGFYDAGLDRNFSFTPFGATGYQFPPQVAEGVRPTNILDVGDNTVFHSFWVTVIDDDENDRYDVTVWIDGAEEPAVVFEGIQLGDDTDCDGINHLHMGFHSTPQVGGFQVDYLGYADGASEPVSACGGGFAAEFDPQTGAVELTWSPGGVDSYTILRDGAAIAEGLVPDTTSFTDTSPTRPSATYELVAIRDGAPSPTCPRPSVSVGTVVCPELTCATDRGAGAVTLSWTAPGFVTPASYNILRSGAIAGTAAADATSFTDSPDPGEYTYELEVVSEVADACAKPFCDVRLFGPGVVEVVGDGWDVVSAGGVTQIVTTTDGAKSLYFPAGDKTVSDAGTLAVIVEGLGAGEVEAGRFRVEIQARYEHPVRLRNQTNDSFVDLNLVRTGVSTATDDRGETENVEQVPAPPVDPTLDSASSTIVNTDSTGLLLEEGLNLISIESEGAGTMQLFALRIGLFSDLDARIGETPCPSGLSCAKVEGGAQLTWSSGLPHAYEIERDGDVIATIPMGETRSFVDPGFERGLAVYTLRATDDDTCPEASCTVSAGVPDENGFIRDWLFFGPVDWGCVSTPLSSCDSPGAAGISADHIAGTVGGGRVDQETIRPVEGMEITLAGTSIKPAPRADINPNAPAAGQWFAHIGSADTIDYNSVFGGDPGSDYMVYAVFGVRQERSPVLIRRISGPREARAGVRVGIGQGRVSVRRSPSRATFQIPRTPNTAYTM